ncbi:glycogen debranching protein [Caldimonas brevitalea]|uniref:Glycogen debranching protein n=1 Tax=Caldimonas brevitalea TaxID=413882 RepID=A0A0G3BQ90_9BURK|nr:glycogen debranching protein [Caldimonas brevitalea]
MYSSVAEQVELCLFDALDQPETRRIELLHHRHNVWYGYVPDLAPGALYGFRVHGPYAPEQGLRCNPHKLLLDPYARAIVGELRWSSAHYSHEVDAAAGAAEVTNTEDNAALCPKCQVVDEHFDWGDDALLHTPWSDTLIYEVHVKGFTQQHPEVPPELRGTYAGLASPPAIAHLKRLGVTAVELLPVHAFIDDERLVKLGLRNYWGYNSIGFFAPEMRYSASKTIDEFKQMVKTLHANGIEVILDVVYNHTAEGHHLGPTLSLKGIDNPTYYRLKEDDKRLYVDYTGCGNTVNTRHQAVVRLIMDSLRYWVTQMHVDGFRFDLASALGRGNSGFDPHASFFAAIAQDPVLSHVKLIAEPWDLGEGGYQVGGFPAGWAEWNGRYRDTVRGFWSGQEGHLAELSKRLCGSSDIYQHSRRCPTDSVNLVTVHDGFTLQDLVSYNHKHNEANGEDNRDGENHNRSWNRGAEGDTDDELVLALRERQKRNLLLTLLLSQGTPLLLGGDELGRTQRGNNNAYCQDNPISWFDWTTTPSSQHLCDFVARLTAFRRSQPALRRTTFFTGRLDEDGHKDLTWLTPEGVEMRQHDWEQPALRAVAALVCGWKASPSAGGDDTQKADSVLILINAQQDPITFTLPDHHGPSWVPRFDTRTPGGLPAHEGEPTQDEYVVAGRSIAVLTQPSI